MEQEREAVTARLEQAQQVLQQAREEMRSHVEQAQQIMERREEIAHLERERAESGRQAVRAPSNKGKMFEEVQYTSIYATTLYVWKNIRTCNSMYMTYMYMHFPRWANDKSGGS